MADPENPSTEVHPHDETPHASPRAWEADVVLKEGSLAHVRPIAPEDADRIRAFHAGQSPESIYLRFFAPLTRLSDRDVHHFTHVDHRSRVAIVAVVRDEIIGIARFDRVAGTDDADVAFNVADSWHGRGVGSILLEHLAAIAAELGVRRFKADVLPQNRTMMNVFMDAGYELAHSFGDGVIAVEFTIAPTGRSAEVQAAREHRAEARSMAAVLAPTCVAVVGASRRPDAVGSLVLDAILDGGFTGAVHPVNPTTDSVRGLPAYPRVADVPGPVDMAVLAVPAERTLEVVDDCGAAGVRSLVVLSSGFAESGPAGEALQAELLHRARAHGMRVVGPGSVGVLNTSPAVRLTATTVRDVPHAGHLGMFAQSGGIAVALTTAVARRRLGVSAFAAAGNRIDVSGNDLMQYFIDDDTTTAVALYLESIGNARKFSRIARRLSLRKPVIAVKTGTTGAVPPGHRARATRVEPEAFDALLDRSGVIRAHSLTHLVDIADLVLHQPLPAGPRLAVIGTSHGLSAEAADHAVRAGLVLAPPGHPVILDVGATAEHVATAVEAALADDAVDAVLVCLVPPLGSGEEEIARAVAHVSWAHDKPCLASFVGLRDVRDVLHRAARPETPEQTARVVPLYDDPASAVAALAAATRYARWRASDHGHVVTPTGVDQAAARRVVDRVLTAAPHGRELDPAEAATLLATYGIHVAETFTAADPAEAVDAAARIDGPVLLRPLAPELRERAGTLREGLLGPQAVADAAVDLFRLLAGHDDPRLAGHDDPRLAGHDDSRLVVQAVPPVGVATRIRSVEDPLFGPVVSFGLDGPATSLLGDLTHGIPPLTDVDALGMIHGLRTAPLLTGTGAPGATGATRAPSADVGALTDLLCRVAHLADDVPEVAHLDLGPVVAHPSGTVILGAHVRIAPAHARTDAGRRALT